MPRVLTLLALWLAVMASPVLAQDFPPAPDGPIYDAANIIPADQEAALDQQLRDYNAQTGRAVIVATVTTLGGEEVEIYTRNLAEFWNIGGATTEEGVLLLVAPNERELWISTSRGLDDRFTDISAGRIYRDTLRPAFRKGDFSGGITSAINQIIERLDLSPADARAIAEAEAAAEAQRETEGGFPIGTIIWPVFILFFFVVPMFSGGRRRRYRRGGVSGVVGDIILWEAGKAVARGLSDSGSSSWGGGGFGGGGGGGFGGFGGGGGGFGGGGAGGGW